MVRRCTAGLAVVTGVLFVCGACRAAREPSREIPAAEFNKELIDYNDTFVDALLAGVGGAVK